MSTPWWRRGGRALLAAVAGAAMILGPAVPAGAQPVSPDEVGIDAITAATSGASAVAAGVAFSCALTTLGRAYCWGDNGTGQLGDGNSPTGSTTAVPVDATGDLAGAQVVQIVAGGGHACVLDTAGAVYCWGNNSDGQLGIGPSGDIDTPAQVTALAGVTVVELAAGIAHTCAVDATGAAYCWGDDTRGQLGDAGGPADSDVPVPVTGLAGATGIAAGRATTCAVTSAGLAYCWGEDTLGQLGDGVGAADSDVPVPVDATGVLDGRHLSQVDIGAIHGCAVDTAGLASCWGEDFAGELGDGGFDGDSFVPINVDTTGALAGESLTQVAIGEVHTCAVSAAGEAYCWGENQDSQIGDGNPPGDRDVPTPVLPGERTGAPLRELDSLYLHTCAIDTGGAVYCWGAGGNGRLGDGGTAASAVPVRVDGLPLPPTAPTGVTATAAPESVAVAWTGPADLGTGTFERYVAVAEPPAEAAAARQVVAYCEAGDEECRIEGLAAGTAYAVLVAAVTTDGVAFSEAVTVTPLAAAGGGGSLADTGPPLPAYLLVGGLLIGAGVLALALARRRRLRWV